MRVDNLHSNKMTPADDLERKRALDISTSFIVQAPAGSGKTELLTQRYLALLAQAEVPEEIIAITFTRKAAAEMRMRILEALQAAASDPIPTSPLAQSRWQLAQATLQRNQQQKWDLLNNPSRLRIQTIDAFCASLARQMPVLSHFGAEPQIAKDPQFLYQQAAKTILQGLESDAPWAEKLAQLLLHLDNDQQKVAGLLSNMLARRDQWLSHIITGHAQQNLKNILETALQNAIAENLNKLTTTLPPQFIPELSALANFASEQLKKAGSSSPIIYCSDLNLTKPLQTLAVAELENAKNIWLGISTFLLTQEGNWRKKVTKKEGFPAPSDAADREEKAHLSNLKMRMEELLQQLSDQKEWAEDLFAVRLLPPGTYTESQWAIITALLELLPILVAELHLLFQTHEVVDYIEVAQNALIALGDPQAPTDLALALDYQIKHILVDEFQDTSSSQFRLLEQLTEGWQSHDGRTLFLVGDPMQSIYRFRKAEVGLFLQAREQGIGSIQLEPLVLRVNFRSTPNIVDWINHTFSELMPKEIDIGTGAVPFCASIANQDQTGEVHLHTVIAENNIDQAQQVIEIIKNSTAKSIAILVRARNDLTEIIPALQKEKIAYRAVEIETLAERPVIQDLFALTRALLHPADRIAWLSILRAPWCGLTLAELHELAGSDHHLTLLECLQKAIIENQTFSSKNLTHVYAVLSQSIKNRKRTSLAHTIYGTWLALGGPASLNDQAELEDAQAYFRLLEKIQQSEEITDISQLERCLFSLFAAPQVANDIAVEIMTIHKAKGLEFDTVILPSLERPLPADHLQLLLYMERPTQKGFTDLLLAPIKASSDDQDPIYNYLRYEDKKRADYETSRLLYVAATRAKRCLHLVGTIKADKKNDYKDPVKNSLLAQLWPTHQTVFLNNIREIHHLVALTQSANNIQLKRFASSWTLPHTASGFNAQFNIDPFLPRGKNNFYSWNNSTMRAVGTVVHRVLQKISLEGLTKWTSDAIKQHQHYYKNLLLRLGVQHSVIDACITQVEKALLTTLSDPRGRWILDHHTNETYSELPLSAIDNNEIKHVVIDRTFIDEHDVRWIIDYKTVDQTDITEKFVEQETRTYRQQLEQYAKIIKLLDPKRAIRLGLYFPLQKMWREWEYLQ